MVGVGFTVHGNSLSVSDLFYIVSVNLCIVKSFICRD
jgi:hypothetical protein